MHLYDRSIGLFGTNGFVGGGIAAAVGAAISATHRGTDGVGGRLLRRRRRQPRRLSRGDEFRRRPAGAGRLRLREQPLRHRDAADAWRRSTPRSPRSAAAYGIPGVAVDGNDVLAVWEAMHERRRRARARGDGPTLIEAKTYRTVGHHEGDPVIGTYRTQDEVDAWAKR